jgi:hypothetical protein
MGVWRRRREAASAGLSAALYSAHHGLYSEAVVSSIASAVALAEVGQFREAVEYVQKAAKALYEAAREVFEQVKVAVQRLVELFVEAVVRVLAWIDEHKAYLFLMAAGVIALNIALNVFKTLAERHERWNVDENVINEVLNAPQKREAVFKVDKFEESAAAPREAEGGAGSC